MAGFSSFWSLRRLGATFVTKRYAHGGPNSPLETATDAAKRGLNEARRIGENLTNHHAEDTKEVPHKVAEKAQEATQQAWDSAKEIPKHTQQNIASKDEVEKESVKETAERCMNTKNNPNC